jgi:HAMP domain-containing protein
VFLAHAVDGRPGARLWGELNPSSVWGSDQGRNPAPPGTFMCLATAEGIAISCPDPAALRTLLLPDDGSMISWQRRGESYLAGRWLIFLGRMYGAPSWTAMLSRPAAEVYGPLRTLRTTFVLGLLLALMLVFTLSHMHLRRTMGPLDALDAGTRRLTEGNFTQPVQVTSGDEFEGLANSFNRMAGELAHQFGTQQALQEVGRAALEAEGPETVLTALFARSRVLVGDGQLSVALCRPDDERAWRVVSARAHAAGEPPHEVRPDPDEVDELRAHPAGFVLPADRARRSYLPESVVTGGAEVIVLPLMRNGALGGALVLQQMGLSGGSTDALSAARRYVDPIGVALVNTQLHDQLETLTWGALTALARAIDAVSPWTAGHSERVTLGALEIGRRLGLPDRDLDLLHRGGLLHDVGKVGVPAALLDKPGKLTPEEYEIIKRHPAIGATILAPIAAFSPVLPLVLHHHELLDGSGYPDRLAGDQIPLLVRVMTVSDVFDALTSDRPYRPAWPAERAIALLRDEAGRHFDVAVVEALAVSVAEGWRPQRDGLALQLPAPRVSSRYSLWPESDRRISRPLPTGLPAGVTSA